MDYHSIISIFENIETNRDVYILRRIMYLGLLQNLPLLSIDYFPFL